jgi:uncharacterized protein YdbL (DUF1318 family)
MRRRLRAPTGLLLVLLALAFAAPAAALHPTLEAARRDGVVGEQADGYLGLVTGSASPEVKKLVEEVNAQRRAKYAEVAKQRGIDVATFAAITGKKLVEESPSGSFVRGADGRWVRR